MVCRHCNKGKVNRPRGLCWNCYYTPGVLKLYPVDSKFAPKGEPTLEELERQIEERRPTMPPT
jgi:hypothetical protein